MKEIITPELNNKLLAYETGVHIGDGCMHVNKKISLYGIYYCGNLFTDYEYFHNFLPELVFKLYGIRSKIREIPEEKTIMLTIISKKLAIFKNEKIGLPCGNKSVMKCLPDSITCYGETHLISLIRGLFDTDGCFKTVKKEGKLYPRATIKNKSKILDEVRDFLIRHGIPCHIHQDKNTLVYGLYINGNKNTDKFFEFVKPWNPKHLQRYKVWKEIRDKQYKRARSLTRIEHLASV